MFIKASLATGWSVTFLFALKRIKRIWILFASYSHVSVYSHTPFIGIICLYSLENIRTNSQIFDLMQNKYIIRYESNIRFNFFSYWQIFASNIRFEKKEIKYLLRKKYRYPGYSIPFLFVLACKIRWFAAIRNKRIEPVFFASKRMNICFIFAYVRFEPNCTYLHWADFQVQNF